MYFLSTIDHRDGLSVTWGYYADKETAFDVMRRNVGDMHECIYTYGVIEQLEPGLFPIPKERHWFMWNQERWGYAPIEPPQYAKEFHPHYSIALRTMGDNVPVLPPAEKPHREDMQNYFLMVMEDGDAYEKTRRCGYFKDRESALQALHENAIALYNGSCNLALIECLQDHLYPPPQERIWFRWNSVKQDYCESEMPDEFESHPPNYAIILI